VARSESEDVVGTESSTLYQRPHIGVHVDHVDQQSLKKRCHYTKSAPSILPTPTPTLLPLRTLGSGCTQWSSCIASYIVSFLTVSLSIFSKTLNNVRQK